MEADGIQFTLKQRVRVENRLPCPLLPLLSSSDLTPSLIFKRRRFYFAVAAIVPSDPPRPSETHLSNPNQR